MTAREAEPAHVSTIAGSFSLFNSSARRNTDSNMVVSVRVAYFWGKGSPHPWLLQVQHCGLYWLGLACLERNELRGEW